MDYDQERLEKGRPVKFAWVRLIALELSWGAHQKEITQGKKKIAPKIWGKEKKQFACLEDC